MTPTRIAATFVGGTLAGKWTYLPQGELSLFEGASAVWTAPTGEIYELVDTVWHSEEDDVLSHQVYKLRAPTAAPTSARKARKR